MRMRKSKSKRIVTLPERFEPKFWQQADGRCSIIREIRKRCDALKTTVCADTPQKQMLCERAVFLGVQLETMESNAVQAGEFAPSVYVQAVNCLIGLLKALGLERKAKAIDNLERYIKEKRNR